MFEQKRGNFFIRVLKKIYYNLPYGLQCIISKIIVRPKFGKNVVLKHGWKGYYGDVSFGNGTRISGCSVYANIHVGNYSVFGDNFRTLFLHHDYNCFSINISLPEIVKKADLEINGAPKITNFPLTEIGSDVWIGEFVTIKGGVHIGDGAIIAARSVVTHDVEPYAVYAGVPARFKKWRFDEDTIDFLKKLRWYDWPKDKIKKNYERLCAFDRTLLDDENK